MELEMKLEHESRLTAVEDRSKSNTRRIESLEEFKEAINSLATAVAVMAEKQDRTTGAVEKLDRKVTALESQPAKRYNDLVDKVSWAIIAAIIAYILGRIGL